MNPKKLLLKNSLLLISLVVLLNTCRNEPGRRLTETSGKTSPDGKVDAIVARHQGNVTKVICKGKYFIDGKQIRYMALMPDKRTLYFERNGQGGGLIYSEDYHSVEAVGGSNERPIYTRME